MAAANQYQYDPLPLDDTGSQARRIFTLYPGTLGDSLLGEISIYNPGDENEPGDEYECLSYCWGRRTNPLPSISLKVKGRFKQLPIMPNLERALKRLRSESTDRKLWVDALCINQKDADEKSRQIAIMDRIFIGAVNVCVWLGEATETSSVAFGFIQEILGYQNFVALLHERHMEKWAALSDLLKQPWFSRRWIVQEIVFAREATVHCGPHQIDWQDLVEVVELVTSSAADVSRVFGSSAPYMHRTDFLGEVEALPANRLVRIVRESLRRYHGGSIERVLSLESLISNLSAFKAEQPHDVVYSILSLAKDAIMTANAPDMRGKPSSTAAKRKFADTDTPTLSKMPPRDLKVARVFLKVLQSRINEKAFHVDYGKSFVQVCKDFISFAITRSGSLDMICRPWAPDMENLQALPSWICPLSQSPYRETLNGHYGRLNADLLVGVPDLGNKTYSASSSTRPEWRFNEDHLVVQGFILDTIKEAKLPAQGGNIPNEWLSFSGWNDLNEVPPEPFWRTLIADRESDGRTAGSRYSRACHYAFTQRVVGGPLNTEKLSAAGNMRALSHYLERVKAVVWMRRLMKMRKPELDLGLAPETAKEGDLIAIIRGCSVPVVLRQLTPANDLRFKGMTSGMADHQIVQLGDRGESARPKSPALPFNKTRWGKFTVSCKLIGECYVHGMMDGNAFKIREKYNIDTSEFELH